MKQIGTSTKLGVVCQFTEVALNPLIQLFDKDIYCGLGFGAVLLVGEEAATFCAVSIVGEGAASIIPVRSFAKRTPPGSDSALILSRLHPSLLLAC